ncbi:MAG: Methyltransferase type 11 [Parcubacteria group bacterium GW2011_GWA2_40_23]|nr:MAG: Methyltransferase type 11 [Parcubacteria group bacterium GW2011_GWA2_40_23]
MQTQISENLKAHNRLAFAYESRHPEIYNKIEQNRLHDSLQMAVSAIQTDGFEKKALDFGCGAGNLTQHLLDLGLNVVAADLSDIFLKLVKNKFNHAAKLQTAKLNGEDLGNFADNSFDFIATYSVLHHVPDYLTVVDEFVRVIKPGGIIYIDHEVNENYWSQSEELKELYKFKQNPKVLFRIFKLRTWINKFRALMNPRFQEEGDIHVWADDHIEWSKIEEIVTSKGCEIVSKSDYLSFDKRYPTEVWQQQKNNLTDMSCLIARKFK